MICNPDDDWLRRLSLEEEGTRKTKYGNVVADSEPMSRAAMFTKNNIDAEFGNDERALLQEAIARLGSEELVSIDVEVGDGKEDVTARLILPRRFAHVAYGGRKLFRPTATETPTYQVIMFFDESFEPNKSKPLPEKDITIRNAHSVDGRLVKIARNSNYFGEWKKGVFTERIFASNKDGDAIFLHAGCRKDTLETAHGPYNTSFSLFVALSANGRRARPARFSPEKDTNDPG